MRKLNVRWDTLAPSAVPRINNERSSKQDGSLKRGAEDKLPLPASKIQRIVPPDDAILGCKDELRPSDESNSEQDDEGVNDDDDSFGGTFSRWSRNEQSDDHGVEGHGNCREKSGFATTSSRSSPERKLRRGAEVNVPELPDWIASDVTGEETELTITADGRPYRSLWDENGKLETIGSLFPTGYKQDKGHQAPWICPVRNCRRRFLEAIGLKNHMSAAHHGAKLNDNLDGTFTIIRRCSTGKRNPCVVVSQNKASPNEPMAEAKVASHLMWRLKELNQGTTPNQHNKPQAVPPSQPRRGLVQDPEPPSASHPGPLSSEERIHNSRTVRHQMEDIAASRGYKIPKAYYTDSRWNSYMQKRWKRTLPKYVDIVSSTETIPESVFSGMVLYLTGDTRTTPCKNCRPGKCIGPPWEDRFNALKAFGRQCAGCLMGNHWDSCSFTLPNDGLSHPDDAVVGEDDVDMKNDDESSTAAESLHGLRGETRAKSKGRIAAPDETVTVNPTMPAETEPQEVEEASSSRKPRPRDMNSSYSWHSHPGRGNENDARECSPNTVVSNPSSEAPCRTTKHGFMINTDSITHLEMEDWEVAPGRVKAQNNSCGEFI